MTPIPSCYAHDFPRQSCPDCQSLRTSMTLRRIQQDLDDARVRGLVQHVKDRYDKDDGPVWAAGWMVRGDVDAA
jgi:hypothetical protein